MTTTPRRRLGDFGEAHARRHLEAKGYRFLAAGWRCPAGELDLVLIDGAEVVFVEVKTRRGSRAGAGFEAVDGRKRRKLRALAEVFLLTHASAPVAVRFDVASVAIGAGERPGGTQVELFEDAF